jgi:hypothetical protein
MRPKTVVALTMAVGALVTLSLVSAASATHVRPGAATPLRVPLVMSYKQCNPPGNSTHVAPIRAFRS